MSAALEATAEFDEGVVAVALTKLDLESVAFSCAGLIEDKIVGRKVALKRKDGSDIGTFVVTAKELHHALNMTVIEGQRFID
jgi:hypothetical protein